jgi:hypothetical protein
MSAVAGLDLAPEEMRPAQAQRVQQQQRLHVRELVAVRHARKLGVRFR